MTPTELEQAMRLVRERRGLLRDLAAVDRATVNITVPADRSVENPMGAPLTIQPPDPVIQGMRDFARQEFGAKLTAVEAALRRHGVDFSNDPPFDPQSGLALCRGAAARP